MVRMVERYVDSNNGISSIILDSLKVSKASNKVFAFF